MNLQECFHKTFWFWFSQELKAEKDNAEVRVDNVEEYQKVVDAEWNILYDKLDRIHKSGAKVNFQTRINDSVCLQHDIVNYLWK